MFSFLGYSAASDVEGKCHPAFFNIMWIRVFRSSWHMLDVKNLSLKVYLLEFGYPGISQKYLGRISFP